MLFAAAVLTACGGGGGNSSPPPPAPPAPPVIDSCSLAGQKKFVLDNMRFWYLWNNRLPATVDANRFAKPEDLLKFLATFSPNNASGKPVDRFSRISTVEQEREFFGEGRYKGFGFSSRFKAADGLRVSRVYESSPAFAAGLRRGQRIPGARWPDDRSDQGGRGCQCRTRQQGDTWVADAAAGR